MSTTSRLSRTLAASPSPVLRCAIYTRKSSDEGLDQQFNSLDAQRESAEAYIASQVGQGWVCIPDRYDDGGISGGTMERPGLIRLLADIEAGGVDAVIIHKLDRLTRSIRDFGKIMEVFEKHKVALVAVTQSLNTSTSMGRLMLHVLLSFAQFERELASERTRDKIAAARRKGMWSGGRPVLGYDLSKCKLTVNEEEAIRVREIFSIYIRVQSLEQTAKELEARGWTTKRWKTAAGVSQGGRTFDKNALNKLITNPIYIGLVTHKDETFDGEHQAIVDRDLWDRAQQVRRTNASSGGSFIRNRYGALLKGLLFCGCCGAEMGHTYAIKNKTTVYRYYTCASPKTGKPRETCKFGPVPAEQIEAFVTSQIRHIGLDRELVGLVMDELRGDADRRRLDLELEMRTVLRERAWLGQRLAAGEDSTANAALQEQLLACDDKAERLSRELASLASTAMSRERVESGMASFDGMWESLTPAEKSSVMRLVLTRVTFDAEAGTVSLSLRDAHSGTHMHGDAA